MLAVLAAITEVIKLNGGKENTTEYLAALVNILYILLVLNLSNIIFNNILHC